MPTSKLKEVYSMLAEWETKAKELAKNEFLHQADAKLEERAKQLFEGMAFGKLGEEEDDESDGVDTSAIKGASSLENELSLAVGEPLMDEPLPLNTTIDATSDFDFDEPTVKVAKDGNDDTVITIDTSNMHGSTKQAVNPDTAPAAEGECICPVHGNLNTINPGQGLEIEPQEKDNNEVIDMTKEPDMDAILESFIALSENADENQIEIVSESDELTEEELDELEENMDGGAMLKALHEAFMSDSDDVLDDDVLDGLDDDEDSYGENDDLLEGKGSDFFEKMKAAKAKKNGGKGTKKTVSKTNKKDCDDDTLMESDCDDDDEMMMEGDCDDDEMMMEGDCDDDEMMMEGDCDDDDTLMEGDCDDDTMMEDDCDDEDEMMDESNARTLANGRNQTLKPASFPKNRMRPGLNENKVLLKKLSKQMNIILAENKRLKLENKEIAALNEGMETKFTAATEKLQEVKGKLYEASIIASKSTCMNKLFLEHVTTQDEKINIVESFGKAVSRNEVQNLFEKFDKSYKKGGSAQLNEGKNTLSKLNPLFKSETNNQEVLNEGNMYNNTFTEKMNHLINYGGKK